MKKIIIPLLLVVSSSAYAGYSDAILKKCSDVVTRLNKSNSEKVDSALTEKIHSYLNSNGLSLSKDKIDAVKNKIIETCKKNPSMSVDDSTSQAVEEKTKQELNNKIEKGKSMINDFGIGG